jgi:hypothetical protein
VGICLKSRFCEDLAAGTVRGLVGAFHKCKAAFWATLDRHHRRETAPSLAKDTSVAMQQGSCTEHARHLFC